MKMKPKHPHVSNPNLFQMYRVKTHDSLFKGEGYYSLQTVLGNRVSFVPAGVFQHLQKAYISFR
jgi:hypothetical protein